MRPLHRKTKGEWAELTFTAKALSLGFTVCRPYGENHRFDFVVIAPGGRITRVQVKSSWVKTEGMYRFKTSGARRHRYRRGEVDFIVAYIVPEDAWYIIPRRELRHDVGYVMPHLPHSRARWEKYRDAWPLLRQARKPTCGRGSGGH